jgi:hypothetical protein
MKPPENRFSLEIPHKDVLMNMCLESLIDIACIYGMEEKLGPEIAENYIDCHMPVEQANSVVSEMTDTVIRTKMRTHWIKIYPSTEQQ